VEVDCPENQWNVDRSPHNGCEYACALDGDGTEVCDGIDNDCDGQIDEDTDLLTDVNHCGACDQDCDFDDSTAVSCERGACLAVSCEDGFTPEDTPLDGCDTAPSPSETLWVDGTYDGETSDGTAERPFETIAEALAEAEEGALIRIMAAPTYAEVLEIDTAKITLRGESPETVVVGPESPVPAIITITADDVRLESLRVVGGVTGIAVRGTEDSPISAALHNLELASVVAPNDDEELGLLPAQAITLDYADGSVVSAVDINVVTGASSPQVGVGGTRATGIAVSNSEYVQIVGNSFSNITGGSSRGGDFADAPDAAGVHLLGSPNAEVGHNTMVSIAGGVGGAGFNEAAGLGGLATGILVLDSDDCVVQGNGVADVTGGEGGESTFTNASAGMGGIAAGAVLEFSVGCSFEENHFETLQGGVSGNFHPLGADPRPVTTQQAFGLWLDEASLQTTVAATNTMSGGPGEPIEPILFLYEQSDRRIAGLSLTAHLNPTNWGKIAIFNSSRIELEDLVISNYGGAAGCNRTPCDGDVGAGIRMDGCFRCSVLNVEVRDISGGRGGFAPNGLNGAADGGNAIGLALFGETSVSVSHLLVHGLEGGDPGLATVESKPNGAVGHGICVYSESSSRSTVDHVTCFGGTSDNPTAGLVQESTVTGELSVSNAIVSAVGLGCVSNHNLNTASQLSVQYAILNSCADSASNAEVTNILDSSPQFEAPGSDFHLVCDADSCSPGVDAGEPTQACGQEPPPNGGRANLGFYGNTNEAATNPASVDEFPCPSE